MSRYRIQLHSEPSPGWTFYDGHVDVTAESTADAIDNALDKLKRGAFRDRPRNSWRVDNVELLP